MRDITRPLRDGHPAWPGDTPFRLEPTSRMTEGATVNLYRLAASTHAGTHLDAPYHSDPAGARVAGVPLADLVGEAEVIDASGFPVLPASLVAARGALPPRVLFRTGQPSDWAAFPADFAPLTVELVHALAARGVRLVGTDAPSVDAFASRDLPVHRALARAGIANLESLDLAGVAPGRYQLLCLPLALPDADAAPVRAVLV